MANSDQILKLRLFEDHLFPQWCDSIQ